MNNNELDKFKSALVWKQERSTGSVRQRDDIAIERAADLIDELQLASECELAITGPSRNSHMTGQTSRPLARIEDGSYGVCEHCEEEIARKRLNALP